MVRDGTEEPNDMKQSDLERSGGRASRAGKSARGRASRWEQWWPIRAMDGGPSGWGGLRVGKGTGESDTWRRNRFVGLP